MQTNKKLIQEHGSSHCAAICKLYDGVLIAYYSGPECTDRQRVQLHFYRDREIISSLTLPQKTGNCILIPVNEKEVTLIYSIFNDTDGIENASSPVNRWRFCCNLKSTIYLNKDIIKITNPILLETELSIGYLVRCSPIFNDNIWYLPIYMEHNVHGLILTSKDGWNWRESGRIGQSNKIYGSRFGSGVLIQPTIWFDEKNILHSLSRDVTRNKKAWYSYSKNKGETWSEPETSSIWNDNNSIVVVNNNKSNPLVVWNDGFGRSNLCLGQLNIDNKSISPIVKLNESFNGSYPNYCFDSDNNLNIVHTDGGVIAWHKFDDKHIKSIYSIRKSVD